mmetsp:Transcript_24826/g.61179  ORF Transcript_24826/g.61179 Transcript_24826/m.61179 type:complete len:239 (+) Transcript_24826:170-886(+)
MLPHATHPQSPPRLPPAPPPPTPPPCRPPTAPPSRASAFFMSQRLPFTSCGELSARPAAAWLAKVTKPKPREDPSGRRTTSAITTSPKVFQYVRNISDVTSPIPPTKCLLCPSCSTPAPRCAALLPPGACELWECAPKPAPAPPVSLAARHLLQKVRRAKFSLPQSPHTQSPSRASPLPVLRDATRTSHVRPLTSCFSCSSALASSSGVANETNAKPRDCPEGSRTISTDATVPNCAQ